MTYDLSEVKHEQVNIVPAQQGFNFVTPAYDDEKNDLEIVGIYKEPIIAWRVDTMMNNQGHPTGSRTLPITTLGDVPDSAENFVSAQPEELKMWAIEYPDGSYRIGDARHAHNNRAELLKTWQAGPRG